MASPRGKRRERVGDGLSHRRGYCAGGYFEGKLCDEVISSSG